MSDAPAPTDVVPADPPPDLPPPPGLRALGVVGALAVGGLVGLLGAFVQADRLLVGTTAVPWGVVLALVTLVLSVRGAAWAVLTRLGGVALFAGWLVVTVLLATESPSGDLAMSGGGRQMTYLLAGVVLGAAAATVPLVPRRPPPGARVPA